MNESIEPVCQPRMLWQVLAAALLAALATAGCNHEQATPAPSQQALAAPVASTSKLDTLPAAVRASFLKDYKGATIQKVKHRAMPDRMVHYTITSVDQKGVLHEDEYRSDGVKVSSR